MRDIKYLTSYAHKTYQWGKLIAEKYKVQDIITRILNRWHNRKLEHDAIKLQPDADRYNLKPIWKYQKALKGIRPDKHYMLHNADGELTTTIEERQQRWTEWIAQ